MDWFTQYRYRENNPFLISAETQTEILNSDANVNILHWVITDIWKQARHHETKQGKNGLVSP